MFGFVYIFTSRSGLLSWVENKTEFFTETKNFKQLNRWFTLSVQQVIISYYDYILNIKLLTFVAYLRHGYILYARGMRVDLFHRWSYLQPCVRCGCPQWHRGVNGSRDVTCHDIWSHWPIFCTPVAFNEHFNLTKPLYWLYHFIFQIRSSSSFPFLKDIWLIAEQCSFCLWCDELYRETGEWSGCCSDPAIQSLVRTFYKNSKGVQKTLISSLIWYFKKILMYAIVML